MSGRPIPVVVVAGFLGAGKTTLVNHLLRSRSGARIGVVVNDFGDVSIDALLVAGAVDGAVELGNGCICCTADADTLTQVLAGLVTPRAGLDAVVIEASGLAEPAAIVRMVIGCHEERIGYGGLLYVVDAENVDATRAAHPEIDRHVGIADLIVVNKLDRVPAEQADRVLARVRAHNPTAAVLGTTDGRIDVAMIVDPTGNRGADEPRQLELADLMAAEHGEHSADGDCDHPHLHSSYDAVHVDAKRPMHPRRLAAFLERPPTGVYRVKGVVRFDAPGHRAPVAVHAVGGLIQVLSPPGPASSTSMVVIGADMDTDAVRAALDDAACAPGERVDAQSMLSITRYRRTSRRSPASAEPDEAAGPDRWTEAEPDADG